MIMDKKTFDKAVDILHESTDLVKNVVEPTSKNAGSILGTFSGFFANVVMYPLKCLNAKFEQKAIAFERRMQEKYNNIPEENRVDSPVNVLGPTLESLKYNIDEEYMQELFANLLISSMDKATQKTVHPKYVKTISSLNDVDAKIFRYLYKKYNRNYILCGRVNLHIVGTNQNKFGLPEWTIPDDIEDYSIFEISRSLIRLSNLGLLDLKFNYTVGISVLQDLYNKQEIIEILESYKQLGYNLELTGTDCIIYINDEGINFAHIVFKE